MADSKKTKVLPQTLEEAHALIQTQEEKLQEQDSIITELSSSLEKLQNKVATKGNILKPSVKIGKKTFQINCGVRHLGENLKPEQLAENITLCEELLKIEGQTILTEEE